MGKLPTQAEVDAYHRDGYLFPIRAFSAAEAQRYRSALEDYEARIGTKLTSAGGHPLAHLPAVPMGSRAGAPSAHSRRG